MGEQAIPVEQPGLTDFARFHLGSARQSVQMLPVVAGKRFGLLDRDPTLSQKLHGARPFANMLLITTYYTGSIVLSSAETSPLSV